MKGIKFVPLLIAGAMAIGACSSGDGGGSTSTSAPEGGTTAAPVSQSTGQAASGDGVSSVFDSAECAKAITAWSAAAAGVGQAASSSTSDLDQSLQELQAFAQAAPDEIRDDLTLVYEAYGEFLKALQDAGYDPASGEVPSADVMAAIQEASQKLSDSDVQAASDRVSAWFDANCGG